MTVFDRLFTWAAIMAKSLDQTLGVWVRGWIYVWLGGEVPNPDMTISTWLGYCAEAGHPVGRAAAAVVDFFLGENHCRDARLRDVD